MVTKHNFRRRTELRTGDEVELLKPCGVFPIGMYYVCSHTYLSFRLQLIDGNSTTTFTFQHPHLNEGEFNKLFKIHYKGSKELIL